MPWLAEVKRYVFETVRCARHNWLHLKMFRISYRNEQWHVRDRAGTYLRFPFYPYLALFEIEGYLRQGEWTLEKGMTVIDVGGCLGEFAVYAALCVGSTGRVLMLEPDQANLNQARSLAALNGGCPELEMVATGLWKEQGVLSFTAGMGHLCVFLESGATPPPDVTVLQVPVHSWSSLADEFQLKSVDLVKMDIEGSELIVIDAAAGFIERFAPRFSIASYHPTPDGTTSQQLEPKFRALGYSTLTEFPGHLTTWAWPAADSPSSKSDKR